jgi:hypothetical protein
MLLSARMKAVRKELKCQIVPCNLKILYGYPTTTHDGLKSDYRSSTKLFPLSHQLSGRIPIQDVYLKIN